MADRFGIKDIVKELTLVAVQVSSIKTEPLQVAEDIAKIYEVIYNKLESTLEPKK